MSAGADQGLNRSDLLRKVANTIVEQFAPAYVIVDESGQALYFSAGTGKYLQAAAGPPNRDIVAMARAGTARRICGHCCTRPSKRIDA